MAVEIYTDGACSGNGTDNSVGGYAFLAIFEGGEKKAKQVLGISETTNQRMELLGALLALETLVEPFEEIVLFTDSAYLHRCWKESWWKKWTRCGWLNSKKQPVANKDLWERLIPYFEMPNITFEKVKGHSGNQYNEIVDDLATGRIRAESFG